MKKAKIYIPSKSAMQSGKGKSNKWLLEFNKSKTENDYLMNWVSSNDTQSQVKLFFSSKDEAIAYAKKNNIDFEVIEPKKNKLIIKSYADNFLS
jgi:alpha-glucosidase (family GH31 glycosyl hydrolase)